MQYTPERKEAVLKKMMPPHARPISRLAIEEGIQKPCPMKIFKRCSRSRLTKTTSLFRRHEQYRKSDPVRRWGL